MISTDKYGMCLHRDDVIKTIGYESLQSGEREAQRRRRNGTYSQSWTFEKTKGKAVSTEKHVDNNLACLVDPGARKIVILELYDCNSDEGSNLGTSNQTISTERPGPVSLTSRRQINANRKEGANEFSRWRRSCRPGDERKILRLVMGGSNKRTLRAHESMAQEKTSQPQSHSATSEVEDSGAPRDSSHRKSPHDSSSTAQVTPGTVEMESTS
ncbi:hypothetical protein BKA70DRAFT_1536439 [Coprinopsis sp. MPI-PUGE-AT-0042]|nr:hypothetical protein BKA70DRAFT_1536439 [Coprinopsis sp. MPI-PUGE-AT-0042]